jgi:dihydroxyacetone kinase-like predicted kinase
VLPTRTVQEGLRAAFEYEAEGDAATNVARMAEAIAPLRTGEITTASRSVSLDGVDVAEGEYLGLVDGRAVVSTTGLDDAVEDVVEVLLVDGRTVLTVLVGENGPDSGALQDRLAERHPAVDVQVLDGGQPHYPLLLWSEP